MMWPASLRHDSWLQLWHPEVAVLMILMWTLYHAISRVREIAIARDRQIAFASALVLLYVSMGTPLKILGDDFLLSAHMVQYVLLSMAVAPLLVWGIPPQTWRTLWELPLLKPVLSLLTYPPFALLLFNTVFSGLLYPRILDLSLQDNWLYLVAPYGMLVSAVAMWWPLMSPILESPRLSRGSRLIYLFFNLDLMMPASVYIIDTGHADYLIYRLAPRVFHLSALADQQLGGIEMSLGMF
ncbi:MAG: cytochrome c oxidase assembly protein, partial [Firmicutes bacterium]|nr:cytochrome c oxidase assembly protein [Bacillota bacterium]